MGIRDSILSFAKSCYQNVTKQKGPNYITELYHNIGSEAKKMVDMSKEPKENKQKDVDER